MTGIAKNAAAGLTVALVFFLTLEGLLHLSGVEPLHERSDPYVGFAGYSPLFVEKSAENGARVFATADNKFDWFNRQQFPVAKEPGVTRVFCLGGSTTYGRPYDDRTSFCGWLEALLPTMDPDRRWEVVNAGGISYASYRIVRLMEELAQHEPDLFVIYTGHNEFLEARTYDRLLSMPGFMRDLGSLASRLRFYTVLSDIVYPTETVLDTEIDAVLDNSVGPEDYHRDDARRDAVLEHFGVSLGRMARIAEESEAEVIFVTPASNIRDFSPFKAEPRAGLDPADIRRIEGIKTTVAEHLEAERHDRAATSAGEGLALDPRDAELLFLEGRALLGLGSIDEAAQAFVAARDEDVAPLRALTPVRGIVSEVASEHAAGLVDFTGMMRDVSPHRIPGDEHFLDHVHPSIESHRMLALAIADEMADMGIADRRAPLDEATVSGIVDEVMSGVDVAAHATALANLARVLTWAGKQEEAMRLAGRATEMSRDPHTLFQMLTVLVRNDRHEEALPYSRDAARLMPDNADIRKINGIILSETGRKSEALEELRAAARLDAGTTDVHYHLGLVLSELGQADRAARAYRTAIEAQPDNADALNNLGVILAQRGELAGAVDLFQRAVQANPAHAGATQNLARARRMLGG
ncbi:MAG: tetratricopeptide repeat protein [Longimicrobiales bacterium]|nr:tetratricopeptide repeat protein [Longimicrobiales bacterium]